LISTKDFVTLKVSNDTFVEAINYACRSVYFTYDRMNYGPQLYNRLIRIVVGVAIEKTFEEYLRVLRVPFETTGRTHWRQRDKAEFDLKKLKLDIKGYHVYPAADRHFPDWFLDVEGLVPKDQLEKTESPDIYLQAFLVSPQINNSIIHQYVANFPVIWANRWREPRNIIVNGSFDRLISFFGENASSLNQPVFENFDCCELVHVNFDSITSEAKYCSLQYARTDQRPDKPLIIQIANNGSHIINSKDWIDLWLQEPTVTFTGWGTKQDYKSGKILPPHIATRIYTGGTRTFNYCRLIQKLRPLKELIDA
jgi:hypothetical protein